jgi:hypothetical protein
MQTTRTAYFSAYPNLKLTRDAQGVLVVEFHTKGGAADLYGSGPKSLPMLKCSLGSR